MDFICEIPCIVCPPSIGGGVGPVDPANPFVNLSSETPDTDDFIGRRYTINQPPLGTNWRSLGCIGWCLSAVSQEDADLCAARQAVICLPPVWPVPCPECPPTEENPRQERPVTIYYNNPVSCQVTCPDGSVYTFTVAAGLFASPVNQDTVDLMAKSYACNKAVLNQFCLGSLFPVRNCSNSVYIGSAVASTVNAPVTFEMVTALPDGLLLTQNETVAFITGTPTTPGDYAFTIKATDVIGQVIEKVLNLSIFGVATDELPDGEVGEPYSVQLQSGGTPAGSVTWSITAGTLPDGLTLNPVTGVISGDPTTEETQTLTVTVTDGTLVCHKSMGIQIAGECGDPLNVQYFGSGGLITTGWENIILPAADKMADAGQGNPGYFVNLVADGRAKVHYFQVQWGFGATVWWCTDEFVELIADVLFAGDQTDVNVAVSKNFYAPVYPSIDVPFVINQIAPPAAMGDALVNCVVHCVDHTSFGPITWDAPVISEGGAATASGTSGPGLTFQASTSNPGGGGDSATVEFEGSYTVDPSAFGFYITLRLIVTNFVGNSVDNYLLLDIDVEPQVDGNQQVELDTEIAISGNGVYDFPLVLATPPGSTVALSITVDSFATMGASGMDITGIFLAI